MPSLQLRLGSRHASLLLTGWTVAVLVAALAAARAGGTVVGVQRFTLYSVGRAAQFRNDADDRQRGMGANPFGKFNDTAAQTQESGNGPFPGDQTLFTFDLYTSAGLTKKAGSAVFTCIYNFGKNAFCDATYHLNRGTLFGAGAFNFDSSAFTLAITGGYGSFAGVTGDAATTQAANHAQRVAFTLEPTS